ncbi:MAG TPA: 2-amino-4-hydroxy-6-hydroxymethyldihydropteridine diphosphokinase [Gemmatimonadaceae bacterium]|nr:2-amino-4-hydroxy-6-hydroxymethyldihydropteridine diphosphokinase [Gemmatimonadaceae bacterium]
MRDVAFIALGSNLGDRDEYLRRGRDAIAALPGSRLLAASSVEETAPLGDVPQGPYLNQMVAIETELEPHALLDALLEIERANGRERSARWGPRTLDLDIVCFDRRRLSDARLAVPHPALGDRDFWRRELAELRKALHGGAGAGPERAARLPAWACVGAKRRAHIERVVLLLEQWAEEMRLDPAEAEAWRDAGWWHDALRDADERELRALVPSGGEFAEMLHGPAAATRLAREGEARPDVLEAIRYHTVGHARWTRPGRALYMADFLEPGRPFARADRAFLASQVPHDFDGVFRQVVRERIAWTIREGKMLFPETVALWNALR